MQFEFKHFTDLKSDELYDILQLRAEIFVVEMYMEDGIPHFEMLYKVLK